MRTLGHAALVSMLLAAVGCSEQVQPPPASRGAPSEPNGTVEVGASTPAPKPPPGPPPPPLVELDGTSRPAAVSVVAAGARVYSRSLRTWVREKPSRQSERLGYLRAGASSPTSAKPAGHDGCKGGWYPVEPEGYVCVGKRATLDPNDPIVVATREHRPDHQRKLPWIYGTVRRPGPVYARLPGAKEMRDAESDVDDRMERWLDAEGEIGASYAQDVWMGGYSPAPDPKAAWQGRVSDPLPALLRGGRALPNLAGITRESDAVTLGTMGAKVGHSFLYTVLHEGRRFGITTDLRVLPTDRLRPIQGSDFHGWRLGVDIDFPFVVVRHPKARFWIYQSSSGRRIDAGRAPYRAAIPITGKQRFFEKKLHYETKDGKWISDRHASRIEPAKRMPGWGKNGEKWIDVNLTKQAIVLYEGTKPVYTTLISSGEAGLEDPDHTTATKRGIFRIHTKHITATMASNEIGEEFELRDVPYVQYFDKEGYALHGAYWHDRFGMPKSHGCINLSPEDARRIFHWTEPRVPAGWHAKLLPLTGTVIFIHP